MANPLKNKSVAILATDGVEQVELTEPRNAVEETGATVRFVRKPDDLPAFRRKIVEEFAEGRR